MNTEFEKAARDVVAAWDALSGAQRRIVSEHAGSGLYKALHGLAVALDAAEAVEAVAPPAPWEEPVGYPPEKRVADLERMLEVQRTRLEALHHARKTWVIGLDAGNGPHEHARHVTTLAQAFEQYLTDGTVHEVPTITEIEETRP